MADNPKVPVLEENLRKTFESVYFGNLTRAKRRSAVTKALEALEPMSRKEVVSLVNKVRKGTVTLENGREDLAAWIVTGKALSGLSQTPTKAQMKKAEVSAKVENAAEIASDAGDKVRKSVKRSERQKNSATASEAPTRESSSRRPLASCWLMGTPTLTHRPSLAMSWMR